MGSEAFRSGVAETEARWQAAWREDDAFATPPPEEGRADVQVFAGASSLLGPITLDQARRYLLADFHARFCRTRGDAVLFSLSFEVSDPRQSAGESEQTAAEEAVAQRRGQLESLGLSVDWSRSFESADDVSERWSQQMFLTLFDAGMIYRGEHAMHWCARCRTLLPGSDGNRESCRLCQEPVRQMPAGEWYLRLDANAKGDGELPKAAVRAKALAPTEPVDLLGRTEGVELDAKAIDGTPLTLFTPFPKQIEEARFVALSPNHPALEGLIQDPGLSERIAIHRSGNLDPEKRDLDYPSITDTGLWIHVPGLADPLPLIVSLAVDARFGVTAVLGIPSADPRDEPLSKYLPSAPALRWGDSRSKKSALRPALRFRAHSLPISTSDQHSPGASVPLVDCAGCGVEPVPSDALPVSAGDACTCPKCGKPARLTEGVLDPQAAAWAEMLIAIPPADRAKALPDHPELRRWMPAIQAVYGADTCSGLLCNLVLLEALRDLELAEPAPNGEADARGLITGKLEAGDLSAADLNSPIALVEQAGADTLRFALLHAAAPQNGFKLSEFKAVLRSSEKFLKRLWSYAEPRLDPSSPPEEASIDGSDRLRRQLARWCDMALRKVTENNLRMEAHRATRNVELLLARIEDFERRALDERDELTSEDSHAIRFALCRLITLLAPIAPHICEELWQQAGNAGRIVQAQWPDRSPVGPAGGDRSKAATAG